MCADGPPPNPSRCVWRGGSSSGPPAPCPGKCRISPQLRLAAGPASLTLVRQLTGVDLGLPRSSPSGKRVLFYLQLIPFPVFTQQVIRIPDDHIIKPLFFHAQMQYLKGGSFCLYLKLIPFRPSIGTAFPAFQSIAFSFFFFVS